MVDGICGLVLLSLDLADGVVALCKLCAIEVDDNACLNKWKWETGMIVQT